MGINADKAFEVSSGLVVNDRANGNTIEGPFFTGGPSSPIGLNLPTGSYYVQNRTDGVLVWRKYGNNSTDWTQDNATYRNDYVDDIYIPAGNTRTIAGGEFEKEMIIDGVGYIL